MLFWSFKLVSGISIKIRDIYPIVSVFLTVVLCFAFWSVVHHVLMVNNYIQLLWREVCRWS